MRTKSVMLGGLAAIASALMLAGSPALAQTYNNTQQPPPATDQQNPNPDTMSPDQGTIQDQSQGTGQTQDETQGTMQDQSAMQSAQPLSAVTNPTAALASATVQDSTGQPIGQVKSVHTSSAGTARSVAVSLTSGDNSGKVVTIKADKLNFDPNSDVVSSSLTLQEIDQLPMTQSP